jgi:hypothetical protein
MFTDINRQSEIINKNLVDDPEIDIDDILIQHEENKIANTLELIISNDNLLSEPEIETQPGKELEPEPSMVSDTTESTDFVSPTQKDTLFWCIYIAVNGYNDYLQIDRNYGVKELEIKKEVSTTIQNSPDKFKNTNTKITKVLIQEILSDLLTSQKETGIFCLIALTVHYNINVILVDASESYYLEYISNKDVENPTHVLYKDKIGNYKLKIGPLTGHELAEFKTNKTSLENHNKPLKSISNYKVDELKDLSRKIGVFDESKKYKKDELYDLISEAIRWK